MFTGIIFLEQFGLNIWIYLTSLGGLALIFLWLDHRFYGLLFEALLAIGLLFTFSGIGGTLYLLHQSSLSNDIGKLEDRNVTLIGEIVKEGKCQEYGCQARLRVNAYLDSGEVKSVSGIVLLRFKRDSLFSTELKTYDIVCIRAKIANLKSKYPDYIRNLRREGINLVAYSSNMIKLDTHKMFPDGTEIRDRLIEKFTQLMGNRAESRLACAMLLGKRLNPEDPLKDIFNQVGASHLLAISGLHVGILYSVISFSLSFLNRLKGGKKIKYTVVLLLLWLYLYLIGPLPAATRAVIMFSSLCLFKLFYARYCLLNVLGFSAIIHMLANPIIAFHIGFQLSYAAVIGIIFVFPFFEKIGTTLPYIPKVLFSYLGISISAGLFTSPLVSYYFGQFPTYFLVTGILTNFLTTVILIVGICCLFFCYVPFINSILAYCLNNLLGMLIWICHYISTFPYVLIKNLSWHDIGFNILLIQLGGIGVLCFILLRITTNKGLINK